MKKLFSLLVLLCVMQQGCALSRFPDKTYKEILKKIRENNLTELNKIINAENINYVDENGSTILHLLVNNINPKTVEMSDRILFIENLMDRGININAKDLSGQTFLHKFVWLYNIPLDHRLFDSLKHHGFNFYQKDNSGLTLLHVACLCDKTKLVQMLLPEIKEQSKDSNGHYPVHYVTSYQTLEALLGKDLTGLNIKNDNNQTLLDLIFELILELNVYQNTGVFVLDLTTFIEYLQHHGAKRASEL